MNIFTNFNDKTKNNWFYQIQPRILLVILAISFPPIFASFAVYPLVEGNKKKKLLITLITFCSVGAINYLMNMLQRRILG
jgi:hypothetical protein